MSALSDLKTAQNQIEGFSWTSFLGPTGLLIAIDDALSPPAPTGTPATIEARAQSYAEAATRTKTVSADLHAVATTSLPTAWKGQAAETAAQAVSALSTETGRTGQALQTAAAALQGFAADLAWAKAQDQQGVALLKKARSDLGWGGLDVFKAQEAQNIAANGVNMRVAAAQHVQDSATKTNSTLNQLTSQARAERVTAGNTDALSAVVLAADANPGGPADAGDILTDTQLARASQRLDGMSAADQAAFDTLVANARSPQEAAYLWKVLAAGHSLSQIEAFDTAIHPHGDDPTWLAEHLTPTMTTSQSSKEGLSSSGQRYNLNLTYQGQNGGIYSQGQYDDCVAASTVVAQASMDPTVMLGLTTGGTANGDDSAAAFQARLQHLYQSEYVLGQRADGDSNPNPNSTAGLGSAGETMLANKDLGSVTGSTYQYHSLDNTGDRQAALSGIEQSVDSGKPVPIDVYGKAGGHQMMIIGRDGDKLEIYNPWGFTSWVTENQFVNNQLGALTPGDNLATADGLELPR